MTREDRPVIDEPVADFAIEELFLSRTDERGVIQSGNSVFARLAGYEWKELIGAPHRLIRHPDMPKGVFHLMWETLKAGHSFGGYVKNRAKDGRYYWVFAVVVPVEGGYLSVRLKPSAKVLDQVVKIYRRQGKAEAGGMSPEDSAKAIVQAVRDMGFWDYSAFMGYALGMEFTARAEAMGSFVPPGVRQFHEMGDHLGDLMKEVKKVEDSFGRIRNSPANLIILGARLQTNREAMKVVAQNYGLLAEELLRAISELAEGLEVLLNTAFDGRMGYCASYLYREAIEQFRETEPNRETWGHEKEVEVLVAALKRFSDAAIGGCSRIGSEVGRFTTLANQLRRQVSGLAVTRVICRIETAAIREETSGIDDVAEQLSIFQGELEQSLDRINLACQGLGTRADRLRAA